MGSILKRPSPNFNERAGGVAPSILILHYTGTKTAKEADAVYMDASPPATKSAGPVSPHYMIDRDGTITQYVDEDKRAWHAGRSWWAGREDINSHSIGIELVNPGHQYGYIPFTREQMDALATLARDIIRRHNIPAHNVLGHSDIAPTRKPDPGELLDWAWLAARGVGAWPDPEQRDYDLGEIYLDDEKNLRQALTDYGYDPRLKTDDVVQAFQRHFQTEAFKDQGRLGRGDRDTAARLHWLLRRRNGGIAP